MNVNRPVQMVLVSSSKFFLEGIRRILENADDLKIIAESSNLEEIESCFAQRKPDLLFIDNRILNPNNRKLLDSLSKRSPYLRIILLDNQAKRGFNFSNVIRITKETDLSEIIRVLRGASSDHVSTKRPLRVDRKRRALTKRELRVLDLVSNGLSNKQTAKKLSISEKTVKAHLTSIYNKLELRSRYELMAYRGKINRRAREVTSLNP